MISVAPASTYSLMRSRIVVALSARTELATRFPAITRAPSRTTGPASGMFVIATSGSSTETSLGHGDRLIFRHSASMIARRSRMPPTPTPVTAFQPSP